MRAFGKWIMLVTLNTLGLTAHAAATTSAPSSSTDANKNIQFQISGGTSQLNQYMANDNLEHPPAGFFAGRYHKSGLEIGLCYLGLYHTDAFGASSPGVTPNANEVDSTETFNLTSLCGGFTIGHVLMLDAGYGLANFTRKTSMPNSSGTQTTSYDAHGAGWMFGGSLIPLHLGNKVSLGATYYYFDAKATDYSSDVVNSGTETIRASNNGSVHAFGWYGGLSVFIGL